MIFRNEYAVSNTENALICNIKQYENVDNNDVVKEVSNEKLEKVPASGKKSNIL